MAYNNLIYITFFSLDLKLGLFKQVQSEQKVSPTQHHLTRVICLNLANYFIKRIFKKKELYSNMHNYKKNFNINLFIYFWLCWVFVAVCRLSLVAASGGYSLLWCTGFSLRWLLLWQSMGSRRAGFSSCGMWAQ